MKDSRAIEDLHPSVQVKAKALIAACAAEGIKITITATLRDIEFQNSLYAKGRTAPGSKVTNARGGESWHNFGLAFDVVPVVAGKAVWGTTGEDGKLWQRVGALGVAQGLEWGGHWTSFKDLPHFQYTQGLTLQQARSGATLK